MTTALRIGGSTPARRQRDLTPLLQLEHEPTRRHVFVAALFIAPVPSFTQQSGKLPTMRLGISTDQCTNRFNICTVDILTLRALPFEHIIALAASRQGRQQKRSFFCPAAAAAQGGSARNELNCYLSPASQMGSVNSIDKCEIERLVRAHGQTIARGVSRCRLSCHEPRKPARRLLSR